MVSFTSCGKPLRAYFQMLLFPEGTDLNPRSQTRSDAFALTNARPKLTHLLYPRVRGFTFLHEVMMKSKIQFYKT